MIEQSLRIKLNQFMLAYERQCVQLEFQRQNIKQNVMLSILETKNGKKVQQISMSQLQKSVIKEKVPNLASSKQTKFSDDKQIQSQKHVQQSRQQQQYSDLQRSKLNPTSNSKLLERSNLTIKNSKLNNNNYMKNDHDYEEFQQKKVEEVMEKSRKSGMFNNPYYKEAKDKNGEGTGLNGEASESNMITFSQRKSVVGGKSPKNSQNQSLVKSQLKQPQDQLKLTQSSISRPNHRPTTQQQHLQKQLQQNYSALSQSKGFQKASRIYTNSQKLLKQNPSSINNKQQQSSDNEPEYPTFKRPSFQFVANMEELRQSNPNYEEENDEEDREQQVREEQKQMCGKWNNSRGKHVYEQKQPSEEEGYYQVQNNGEQDQQIDNGNQQNFSHMQQDQSMMLASQLNQKPSNRLQQQRKSYFAFQINMDKSTLPANQNIQQLKKKKILQLQRKRLERMQNNSRRKLNPSEISNNSKPEKKQHSNVFMGNNNNSSSKTPSRRQHDNNRDSLNKSVNERKNHQNRNLKSSNIREDETGKESVFHDNKTIMTKYGDQSRIGNRSTSPTPINTVKTTIQTDKRPPLSKNRREENIFAGEPTTYQRQRSSQKLSADPKIIPIDRKNSFQKKSNLKIMVNAITYTCLPGELNRREREKLIDVLDEFENEFFIFLFKEYSRKVIKGIYILESNQEKITKIYGDKAPGEIFPEQVHEFYRFDSGSREFKKIDGCKSFSFSIHAIDMK